MVSYLQRISSILLVLCLFNGAFSADPTFPDISQIEIEFYQTEVQVIDVEQQATAFATEYFDNTQNRGRVEVLAVGDRQSIFYYNETNEILEVSSTKCKTSDITDSEYDYTPIFYGWLNKEPLRVGPSASIWFAQNRMKDIKYVNTTEVKGIKCDLFKLEITEKRDEVIYYFFFAIEGWTTPYQFKGLRVPIRVQVIGKSSKESKKEDMWVPINIVTDFAYFRPTITDWTAFQPPLGIGCPLRKATMTMPDIPKTYKYSAEVYDVLKGKNQAEVDIEYQQVWYDSIHKIARLDKYTKTRYTSELYDFDTGVTYSTINGETCDIKPLRNSFFEGYDNQLVGHMKEPGEVLNLEGTFYYMGKRRIRGIVADVFESAKKDVQFMEQTFARLVVTIYFTQEFLEVAVDGETETRVPIYYMVTGWANDTTIGLQLQYNVFGFDDIIWPDMFTSYQLGRCFPLTDDRSYFVLVLNAKPEIAAKMEARDALIIEELRGKIAQVSKISLMRIPLLRADYKTTGVYITGLMLNRPPALMQFWLEKEGDVKTRDQQVKAVIEAAAKEECAFACVDEGDFPCKGFYFCNEGACFLKSRDLLEGDEDDPEISIGDKCQTWIRAEIDSTNSEEYLGEALKNLEDAVLNLSLSVVFEEEKGKDTLTYQIPVQDIVIGTGPYSGIDGQEKPYSVVLNFAKLKVDDETTQDLSYVDTLNDCYKECKNAESIACSSFSYCPDASNKQCLISSKLIVDKKTSTDDTDDDRSCYVYSLKYLDFYTAYPGKVALVPGEDSFMNVKSAEECAQKCRMEKKFQCRGFEFCKRVKSCVLHSKHILTLEPGQMGNSKKNTCTHYAAKYSADYYDLGYTLIDDDSDKRTEISLEDCARICSEELTTSCKSFNYCPASGPYMTDSSCSLSSKVLTDSRVPTTTKDKCHHYEKKDAVEDWATSKKSQVTTGYTKKGFTGLVIGTLVIGLVVGIVGFVLYSYHKSRSSGEGMTVRFMKQET